MATPLTSLLGKNLTDFKLEKMIEVYKTNEDGLFSSSLGIFKTPVVAEAFAAQRNQHNDVKKMDVIVLTDGKEYFVFDRDAREVSMPNEKEILSTIKRTALEKLSSAEQVLLGLVTE